MKKILPIANGIALIFTVFINYLSNTGMLNGNTMKTMSDKYFSYFTPAGYAFSIWGIIYLGLLGFVCYTGRSLFKKEFEEPNVLKIGWWFVISCVANSLWVVAWLYDYTGLSVLIMGGILFSLVKIIINTRMELEGHPFTKYLFVFWPFAFYSGWISVALVANISAYLTKVNWNGWGISNPNWAIIMICVAGLINIMMIKTRNLREFALVGIWALIAISVSNKGNPTGSSIVYACYGVSVIILIFIIISSSKSKNRSIKEM